MVFFSVVAHINQKALTIKNVDTALPDSQCNDSLTDSVSGVLAKKAKCKNTTAVANTNLKKSRLLLL